MAELIVVEEFLDFDEELEILQGADDYLDFNILLRNERGEIPKVSGFVEEIVPRYNDVQFQRDFRISRAVFQQMTQKLAAQLEYDERDDGKEGLSVEKQILVYLWYTGNQDSMRQISRLFGISQSTVHKCVRRVAQALCNISAQVIQWPDEEQQNQIATEIERQWHVPDVIGFIDGTHIRLAESPDDDYINRKGYPSIVLQLITDNRLLILDSYVGWPGSTHDARVFRNSPIYHGLQNGRAHLGQNKCIIGDGAYPLSEYLLTPFRDTGRLTPAQRNYNRLVSGARQAVERTNGHLKGRQRRLRDLCCRDIANCCEIITAACVLHNLCVLCNDDVNILFENDAVGDNNVNNYPRVHPNQAAGIQKRNHVVQLLQQFM